MLTVAAAVAVALGRTLRHPIIVSVMPATTTVAPQATPILQQPTSTSTPSTAGGETTGRSAPVVGGTLKISTRPSGAQVELDGIVVGTTPLTLADVTPGRRTVKVSKSGFRSASRELHVTAGEALTLDLALATATPPGAPRRRAPGAPPLPPPPLPPPPP